VATGRPSSPKAKIIQHFHARVKAAPLRAEPQCYVLRVEYQ
jgi:hypothetical protein